MVEPKVTNPLVHIMDVNMAIIRNKVIKDQVFKEKEPIKKKSAIV
jgi:ribosomal protein S6